MPNTLQNGECCTPAGCMSIVDGITSSNDFQDAAECDVVKVLCNNEHCPTSGLMHRQCFDQWEASILHYLRSCGRARSWSERQRCQNLWTKKGYDLAFKVNLQSFVLFVHVVIIVMCCQACGCLCGRGHLRKDCEWQKKPLVDAAAAAAAGENDQQQRNKRSGRKSATTIVKSPVQQPIAVAVNNKPSSSAAQMMMNNQIRHRANSLSSTGSTTSSSGSSSPPEAVNSSSSSSNGVSSAPVFVLSNNKNKRTTNDRERYTLPFSLFGLITIKFDFFLVN